MLNIYVSFYFKKNDNICSVQILLAVLWSFNSNQELFCLILCSRWFLFDVQLTGYITALPSEVFWEKHLEKGEAVLLLIPISPAIPACWRDDIIRE